MDRPATDPADEDPHRRYLSAWPVYLRATSARNLRHVHGCRHFAEGLRDYLRGRAVVTEWPGVWPAALVLFGTRERFVEAVERHRDRLPASVLDPR